MATIENGWDTDLTILHAADPLQVVDDGEVILTIVIPTRNEAGNIEVLTRRLRTALGGHDVQLVFVDDSDDETPRHILDVPTDDSFAVDLIWRRRNERTGGLGGAVVAGLAVARGQYVCVMDADLQHPPELVPALLEAAQDGKDLVVAVRDEQGRDVLGGTRHAISRGATAASKVLLRGSAGRVSDPMSGFFLFDRALVPHERLRPLGFKILLEILARCPGLRIGQVPFTFAERFTGESKASAREGIRFAAHLLRLRVATTMLALRLNPAFRFALVGLSGLAVNEVALWAAVAQLRLSHLAGVVLATEASTLTNFFATDAWVFPSASKRGRMRRWLGFFGLNHLALVARIPIFAAAMAAGMHYLVANLVALAVLFVARYGVSKSWIWRSRERPELLDDVIPATRQSPTADAAAGEAATPGRHFYDLAGRVTVASAVALPELEFCRAEQNGRRADITIRIGRVGKGLHGRARVERSSGATRYQEHLGPLAANFEVDTRDPKGIEVVVSPLLGRSPHVVYTNIVEALLRFVLVSRDCVLLHSATLVLDGVGVMLSALTDTGKTGTILRLVRERRAQFLSDDMTVLSEDGVAWCYPKPLTISAHTLRAVDNRVLSRVERIKLAIQSRVHSKSGRSAGQSLAAKNLPIMALNALTQIVVPPPKFHIERLVPCSVRPSTLVSHLFFIERGPSAFEPIDPATGLGRLIANTDDAYGFPPFEHFAPAIELDGRNYLELRDREAEIIASALTHVQAWRAATGNFSWADVIPAVLAGVANLGAASRVESAVTGL